jgi:hypothetical protein
MEIPSLSQLLQFIQSLRGAANAQRRLAQQIIALGYLEAAYIDIIEPAQMPYLRSRFARDAKLKRQNEP